jgi:sec-independent protein translocase protein TatC
LFTITSRMSLVPNDSPSSPPAAEPTKLPKPTRVDDPDQYRMTLGDHLDELRTRLIRGLMGFLVAFLVALYFVKDTVLPFFCKPLLDTLRSYDLNPQLYSIDPADTFSLYLRVSMIAAVVFASPWLVYQVWQFVAAGLYPSERKTITRYIPLSIGLLIMGVVFAFYVVVPLTLQFFVAFGSTMKLPSDYEPVATTQPLPVFTIPSIPGDPPAAALQPNQIWINSQQNRIKIFTSGQIRTMPFQSENLVAQQFTIPNYVDLVMMTLLLFGLSFQMPIVVMAIVRIGVLRLADLKAMRRIVYFALAAIAALITPGDVILATVLLLLPLIGLYELGLLLAREPEAVEA